jgi:hypothetical protein
MCWKIDEQEGVLAFGLKDGRQLHWSIEPLLRSRFERVTSGIRFQYTFPYNSYFSGKMIVNSHSCMEDYFKIFLYPYNAVKRRCGTHVKIHALPIRTTDRGEH